MNTPLPVQADARRFVPGALVRVLALAAAVALGAPALGADSHPTGKLDLEALPGCAGSCHTDNDFTVDKRTGKRSPLNQKNRPVCTVRESCGAVFCRKVQTCCVGGECKEHNQGDPYPSGK